MTTGRINQVTIVTGCGTKAVRRTSRRTVRVVKMVRGRTEARHPEREPPAPVGHPGRSSYPIAPTESHKGRSASAASRYPKITPALKHTPLQKRIPAAHHAFDGGYGLRLTPECLEKR